MGYFAYARADTEIDYRYSPKSFPIRPKDKDCLSIAYNLGFILASSDFTVCCREVYRVGNLANGAEKLEVVWKIKI